MLQLIGWMGCLYLIVKAIEIGSSNSFRTEEGALKSGAIWAIAIACLGAFVFFIALIVQGNAVPGAAQFEPAADLEVPSALTPEQVDCVNRSEGEAILDCVE